MEQRNAATIARVDHVLREWRQGDCVLGEHWFAFLFSTTDPLTRAAVDSLAHRQPEAGVELVEEEVAGLVVVTQTCDLIRSCATRPFVEVCPLVEVEPGALREVERGRRLNRAPIPGVADLRLVADLDRVMTLEKAVLLDWARIPGCLADDDSRRLSLALARKRSRFAFPDDFVEFVAPLRNRLSSRHDKVSDEGRALRALREIRVCATPSWDAGAVGLSFWFIRDESEPTFEGRNWATFLEQWIALIPNSHGRFRVENASVHTLDDLTAREYVESDSLDLEHLSYRKDS